MVCERKTEKVSLRKFVPANVRQQYSQSAKSIKNRIIKITYYFLQIAALNLSDAKVFIFFSVSGFTFVFLFVCVRLCGCMYVCESLLCVWHVCLRETLS